MTAIGTQTLSARVLARLCVVEARWGARCEASGPVSVAAFEFLRFGLKQGWACLFGGLLLGLLIVTKLIWSPGFPIARYDALFVAAVLIQVALLSLKMETWTEARVILVFHVVGTIMEIHKTSIGSWVYPEASVFRIGGVPLFTGFMYAAVGSYIARVWRLFDFRFTRHPSFIAISLLSLGIYANFLVDHTGYDFRYGLIGFAVVLFGPAMVHFRIWKRHRSMPLLLGLVLVAVFIWFGENIGTITGTWLYPSQMVRWTAVPFAKLTSWFLLMIVSYTLVVRAHGVVAWRGDPVADERRRILEPETP